jgi:hypothetical protein
VTILILLSSLISLPCFGNINCTTFVYFSDSYDSLSISHAISIYIYIYIYIYNKITSIESYLNNYFDSIRIRE